MAKYRGDVVIWGSVTVKGKDYDDNDIAKLIGKDVKGWKYGGDIGDEGNILILYERGKTNKAFDGKKALPKALKFLTSLGITATSELGNPKGDAKEDSKEKIQSLDKKSQEKVKEIKAAMRKLSQMKSVKTYIGLAKKLQKLQG